MSNIYSIIFALRYLVPKRQRPQGIRMILLLTGVLLVIAGNAHAAITIPFTGVFEPYDDDIGRGNAMVHFTLTQESIVSLTYIAYCKDNNNASMKLYNEWGETPEGWTNLKDYPQPWGPIPLAAGNWTIMLECKGENFEKEGTEPHIYYIPTPYKLTYTRELGQSQFLKDSESKPVAPINNPVTITKGKSFSGWIGYMGYRTIALSGDDYYQFGNDGIDNYYLRLTAGTKIKIRLEYDTSLINALLTQDRDIGFSSYLIKNGSPYNYLPVDVVNDLRNMWQWSGDTSKEFTIPQDGTYLFSVFCGNGPNSTGFRNFPKTNYGGYRMSVIVNGDDPRKGMEVTVLEATWRKKTIRDYINGNKTQHYLDVKFEVENKNNETKTMQYDASVFAPLENWYDIPAYKKNRKKLIDLLKLQDCQYGRIDWDDFCTGASEYEGICEYIIASIDSPSYTIPAHTKKQFTAKIPVATMQYELFDNSFQVLEVEINPTTADDKACYMHGISFLPIRVIVPAIRLLLEAELGD